MVYFLVNMHNHKKIKLNKTVYDILIIFYGLTIFPPKKSGTYAVFKRSQSTPESVDPHTVWLLPIELAHRNQCKMNLCNIMIITNRHKTHFVQYCNSSDAILHRGLTPHRGRHTED